jgi:hypothetical protein
MSEQDKRTAKEFASRASTQARQAAKNSGRAARVAAKIAAEEAGDVVEEINDTAEEAVEAVGDVVKPAFRPSIQLITSPLGKSVFGFSVAILAAVYATHQSTKITEYVTSANKANRRIRPSQ